MEIIIKILSYLYIFLLPFYDVPKMPISGIAISGYIMILLYPLMFINNIIKKRVIKVNLKLFTSFMPFFIVYVASALFNIDTITYKTFNHIVLYLYSFSVYTIGSYIVMDRYGLDKFARIISVSVLIICIIGFIEMGSYYLFGFEKYANFLNHGNNVGVHMGIPRLRSTFNEPSHIALFLMPIFPIIKYVDYRKVLYISIIAFIMTLSASAFVGATLAFIIIVPRLLSKIKIKLKYRHLTLITILVLGLYYIYPAIPGLLNKVFNTSLADGTRFNAWITSMNLFKYSPIIGYGPASYYNYMDLGVFSWYIQLLLETGMLGLLSLLFFLIVPFGMIIKQKDTLLAYCFLGYLFQMIAMNHYYIPGFWILIAFIFIQNRAKNYNCLVEETLS